VARGETRRLVEEQLTVVEQRVEAELALGQHADLVLQLPRLVAQNPYREQLRAQLMLALYRCGRQAEALAVYRDTRHVLISELGVEPSRELQLLHQRMLAHDPDLDSPARAEAGQVAVSHERVDSARRLVTVVVVAGFVRGTRVDPESMHRIVERHSLMCQGVIQRHGGSVQRYGGDAIVGIFGLAELHEDDAVRAVRAGVELRAAVAELNAALELDLGVRMTVTIGIESGAVFIEAGIPHERFATGDAVEVATALARSGNENEILLGERAFLLAAPIVAADALEPLTLPTRAEEVMRWRLHELRTQAAALPGSTGFIGHERELQELRAALARTRAESSCRLVTVFGPAGIGKSRLTLELVYDLGSDVTVVIGHCLSYGEGITYHPLAEIVSQLSGGDLHAGIRSLLDGEPDAESIERRVLAAVGRSEEAIQTEETFWAVRRLLERVARTRPLVIVVDDIHWAEPPLLDMLDHVVTFSSGSAILLVCLARPELLETVPSWAIPQHNRSVLTLGPLDEADAYELVDALAGGELGQQAKVRAVETAEGNPFFLEQIVAVSAAGAGAPLPLSIRAVLAARIDRLEPAERNLLGLAAVEGRSFHREGLSGLLDAADRPNLGVHLAALVRKQLIRPDRSDVAGEDGFRFTHALIRDAAYEAMPKQLRAQLHEKMADRLKVRPSAQAEVVGYHLERAYRFYAELGPVGERERAIATEAAEWLDSAARAALLRGDPSSGASLLERAASLLAREDTRRFALLPQLGEALLEAGRLKDAERVLDEAIQYAQREDVLELGALASVEHQRVRIQAGSAWSVDEAGRVADVAVDVLGRSGDELGECRAWCLRATIKWILGLALDADRAWAQAAEHAQRAGNGRELFEILCWRASAAAVAPTPVHAAIRQCNEIRNQVASSPVAVAATLHPLALLHAMDGDFVQARALIREADAILDDLGRLESTVSHHAASVELLAGQPATAESKLVMGYQRLREMGEKSLLATTAAMLGQAAFAQGHIEAAEEYCRVSERTAAKDDLPAQATWRGVQARILAQRGDCSAAEALASDAVRLAKPSDFITVRGDSLFDLAAVLDCAGRNNEADTAAQQALELYVEKGNVVSAERARSWLATRASVQGTFR
jgi:predicted ATPase